MRGNGMHQLMPRLHVAGNHYVSTPRKVKPEDRRHKGKERAGHVKWLDEHGMCMSEICERLGESYRYVYALLRGGTHLHTPSIEPKHITQATAGTLLPAPQEKITMSYSFRATGKTKAEAIEDAEAKYAEVVGTQPSHRDDRAAARAAISAFVNALGHKEDHDIVVIVNGSVSADVLAAVEAVAHVPAVAACEATDVSPAVEAVAEVAHVPAVPERRNVTQAAISVSVYLVPQEEPAEAPAQ